MDSYYVSINLAKFNYDNEMPKNNDSARGLRA